MVKDYTDLMERIKKHEGFVPKIYKDSLGFATIGYGHLVLPEEQWEEGKEYSKEKLEHVFKNDFNNALAHANSLMDGMDLDDKAREVIIEMVFQLGVGGVGKFKKMWEALKNNDLETASKEMIDSNWHKQTTKRCESLANIIKNANK